MSDGGKGSRPRPLAVSNEEYAARWDAIFQKDRPEAKPTSRWVSNGVDTHRGEYWYKCSVCGNSDWIASYGTLDQLRCEC